VSVQCVTVTAVIEKSLASPVASPVLFQHLTRSFPAPGSVVAALTETDVRVPDSRYSDYEIVSARSFEPAVAKRL
jgi:hypothetical protein